MLPSSAEKRAGARIGNSSTFEEKASPRQCSGKFVSKKIRSIICVPNNRDLLEERLYAVLSYAYKKPASKYRARKIEAKAPGSFQHIRSLDALGEGSDWHLRLCPAAPAPATLEIQESQKFIKNKYNVSE